LYDERESSLIARYIMEDVFGFSYPFDKNRDIFDFEGFDMSIYDQVTERLLKTEPWQYIVGKTSFYGLDFKVNTHVLIPRSETEELVALAIQWSKKQGRELNVLEVGTGSGCIAVSYAFHRPADQILSIDISEEALKVARENNLSHGTSVNFKMQDFLQEDLWSRLKAYDLVLSNPPYICQTERELMSASTLAFEPELALFPPGDDPMIFYKKFIDFIHTEHFSTGAVLFLELNEYYAQFCYDLFVKYNSFEVELIQDLQRKDRFLKIQKLSK